MEVLANVQYPKEPIMPQRIQLALSGESVETAEENDQTKRHRVSAKNARFSAAFLSLKSMTTPIVR